jgi:outer membrane protein assembly factor BamB
VLAGLAASAFAGGAAAWRVEGGQGAPVPARAAGPLLWTAEVELADPEFFGPAASGRLPLVERPFDARQGKRSTALSCLDVLTGRRVWSVPVETTHGTLRKVTVSGRIVVVRTRGALQALDLHTGDRLWGHDRNTTGSRATTVLAGGGLILDSGEDENAAERTSPFAVHAYEPDRGRLRWTGTVQPRVVTAQAPILAAGLLLGAATTDRPHGRTAFVYALHAATGRQRWARPVQRGYRTIPLMTLACYNGLVLVSLDGRRLVALNAASGAVRWSSDIGLRTGGDADDSVGALTGTDVPVAAGTGVYLCCSDGVLRAFDVRTGRRRWDFTLDEGPAVAQPRSGRPRPIVANDLVYVTDRGSSATGYQSTLRVLDAADGRSLWQLPARDSHGGPVMAGGALHVPDGRSVTAYDPFDGTVRRRLDLRALNAEGPTELLPHGARLHVLAGTQVLALNLRS